MRTSDYKRINCEARSRGLGGEKDSRGEESVRVGVSDQGGNEQVQVRTSVKR